MIPHAAESPPRRSLFGHDRAVIAIAALLATAVVVCALVTAQWWSQQMSDHTVAVAIVGVAAMGAIMLMYRLAIGRMRAMASIGTALADYHRDAATLEALRVASDTPEALAWNRLLDELAGHRRRRAINDMQATIQEHTRGDSGLDEACNVLSQGVVLVDGDLRVHYANGAAATFLEADSDSLRQSPITEVLAEEEVVAALQQMIGGESRRRVICEARRANEHGETVLRFTVRPVRMTDHAEALILIEDVTQQRLAEESRNAFIAHAAHELRTPLTNIRLYAEELTDDDLDVAARSQSINVINREVVRLERIVGDMLCASEIEAGARSLDVDDVPLEPIFDRLRGDYQPQANEKEVALTYDLPPKWPLVRGDREKIEMVLHNLLGNALKYTPRGGRVSVTVEADEQQVVAEVADTGLGISEEDQARIFERFYRAKDERIAGIPGSGLGLALAREIARMHGGDIAVESEINMGSRFIFTLPIKPRAGA